MTEEDEIVVITFTEERNAIFSLETAVEMLSRVLEDPRYWKWVIVSIFDALQGYMVKALAGTAAVNVFRKREREAWLEFRQSGDGSDYKGAYLDYFDNLFEDIQNTQRMNRFPSSRRYIRPAGQKFRINRLQNIRNKFIHFLPMEWDQLLLWWPEYVDDVIQIIRFLVQDSNTITWREPGNETLTISLLQELERVNTLVKSEYEKLRQ